MDTRSRSCRQLSMRHLPCSYPVDHLLELKDIGRIYSNRCPNKQTVRGTAQPRALVETAAHQKEQAFCKVGDDITFPRSFFYSCYCPHRCLHCWLPLLVSNPFSNGEWTPPQTAISNCVRSTCRMRPLDSVKLPTGNLRVFHDQEEFQKVQLPTRKIRTS